MGNGFINGVYDYDKTINFDLLNWVNAKFVVINASFVQNLPLSLTRTVYNKVH